jgi:excisionase family DNA binding protein
MHITIFSVATAARFVGVSRHSIRSHIRSGALKATQIGKRWLIEAMDLRDFLIARGGKFRQPAINN